MLVLAMQRADLPFEADAPLVRILLIGYALIFFGGLLVNVLMLSNLSLHLQQWRKTVMRFVWRPWGLNEAARIFLAIMAITLLGWWLALLLAHFGGIELAEQAGWALVWQSVFSHWAAICIVLWMMGKYEIRWVPGFLHRGWRWHRDIGSGVIAYVAAMPYILLYAALYQIWLQSRGYEPELQDAMRIYAELPAGGVRIYFIFLALVLAPVAEELLFRGVLLPALSRRFGVGAAIVVSSALFALMHMHVPGLVPLFLLSIALSVAYIYTRSVIVPIVMHMVFNSVSLLAMSITLQAGV